MSKHNSYSPGYSADFLSERSDANSLNSVSIAGSEEQQKHKVVSFDNPSAYAFFKQATAMVFEDPRSQELYRRLERLAPSDANILVIGETGTGKELIARQLHRLSNRADGPFVAINCAALPEQLVESELFGHEKGAFTGAILQKKGWFETANGGTLFLDEIGDLPPATQVKLLRVLQEREISRVGGRVSIPIDVRLVGATNVNLEAAVRAGRFREDLYYRLNVAQLRLPTLRERLGDILPLSEHFVNVYRTRMGLDEVRISEHARHTLQTYPWPGNIRELENVIHHALLVMSDNVIDSDDLQLTGFHLNTSSHLNVTPIHQAEENYRSNYHGSHQNSVSNNPASRGLENALVDIFENGGNDLYADIEARVIRSAFEFCQNNQVQTAKLLGISRNILRHRLKLYGML